MPPQAAPSETKPAPVSEKKAPVAPADLGRGGAQHKAIQQRLKQAAEKLGFRSVIEKEILDGQGSVDLLLERADDAGEGRIEGLKTISGFREKALRG